ncbi:MULTISPECIES: PadR family transcriptional regulator [unclassified Exiguobacterium]|uniref:PadR family transcriptional regulator n=1 Tax=unclassified Exiguobacterium TaxID=2644629 RepID=UPI0003C3FB49|nr:MULTISPECIES: helix-turn-helix transcriptional regulator [unclassified Exiguobacterium]AHA29473.1 PadR family transcriptional regulator [Exiguobacterium sp. MH3]NTY09149.1 PadR family transcriptional regulator [Exiguobacterium sp. JMULE1]
MAKTVQETALTEAVYYILLSLQQPRHGYGIMQFVQELSNDRVKLAAGTLYGALSSLVDKGWIEAIEQETGRKKEYIITNQGRERLQVELDRLKELVRHGQETMGVDQGEQ